MRIATRFIFADQGSVTVPFAVTLGALLLIMGLAVDYGLWERDRSNLQEVADSSALAGAINLGTDGATADSARSISLAYIQAGSLTSSAGLQSAVTVDTPQKTVTVELWHPGHRTFSSLALSKDPKIEVISTATAPSRPSGGTNPGPACVLALDPSMNGAFNVSGGGLVQANNCTVQVNSVSAKAVNFSGNSKLQSGKNCFVGGVDQGLSLMSPAPTPSCPALTDPFIGYSMPSAGVCDHTNFKISGGSPVLSPGTYCGGLTLSSVISATLNPGLYVIKDGLFTMSGGGHLEGDGVTLFLTGTKAGLNWSGGGSYHLIAPAAGKAGMPGFVVFLNPAAAANSKSVISGTGQMYYEGILYFPTQQVEISGTGLTQALASPYTIYIANNFVYSGSSQMAVYADPSKTSVYVPPEFGGSPVGSSNIVLSQ